MKNIHIVMKSSQKEMPEITEVERLFEATLLKAIQIRQKELKPDKFKSTSKDKKI